MVFGSFHPKQVGVRQGCTLMVNVHFQQDVLPPIISNRAQSGCHGGAEPDVGLALGTHGQAVTAVTYRSRLEHVQQLEGYVPMLPSGCGLDSCEMAAIKGWIADGMPEN